MDASTLQASVQNKDSSERGRTWVMLSAPSVHVVVEGALGAVDGQLQIVGAQAIPLRVCTRALQSAHNIRHH